ncbi:MAG: aldehyde dehydrogenase [Acidimicrobiia bacterium]
MTITETSLLLPFIGGESYGTPGRGSFTSINPADGTSAAEIVLCGVAEIDAAVAAARDAQPRWAALAPAQRADALIAWGDLIVQHAEEVAMLDVTDMGKVIADARGEMLFARRMTRYWAGMADKVWGDQIPITPGHLSYTIREPIGVSAVILPWNGPAIMFVSRVSTALAFGNSVVLKPSEFSPQSALRLAELAVEAGIPAGVINVVPGDGETGHALVSHADVAGVNFTGSVPTGRAIATAAAPSFKKVVLELGGKAPSIVFEDAILDDALRGSIWGIFQNAGQVCCASTRLLVQESIADEVTQRLADLARKVRVGHPLDTSAHIGPLVSAQHQERVLRYIDIATDDGGSVVAGGGRIADAPDQGGYYVSPTVVAGLNPDARVASDEIFGPVLSVLTFRDEQEAIAMANATEFGLSANVWTSDSARMMRAAEAIEAGVIWGNTARVMDPGLGFAGFKSSGTGYATGREAIEGMTRVKRVTLRYGANTPTASWPDV